MNASQQLSRMVLLCRDYVPDFFTDETVCRSFQSVRVLCCSDLANVSSHSGQTALVTLVSLLLRMGMQVDLAIPDVTVLGAQPPLSGTSLREALVALSGCLIDRATVHCGRYDTPDLIFAPGPRGSSPPNASAGIFAATIGPGSSHRAMSKTGTKAGEQGGP